MLWRRNDGRRPLPKRRWRLLLGALAALLCCLVSTSDRRVAAAQEGAQEAGAVSALLPKGVAERPSGTKELALQDPIFWNDLVKTLEAGRLRITLEDKSVLNVGVRSSMRIVQQDLKTHQSRLELEFGRVRARVRELAPGGSFEVTTGTATLGVVGTHFYVRGDEKESVVISFDDEVRVRNRDPNVKGEERLLGGELTTVLLGKAPTPKRPATPQEIRQAMEETMPAPVARFQPFQSPADKEPHVVLSGTNLEHLPQLQSEDGSITAEPGPCATKGFVTARLKLPPDLKPGAYEFKFDTPDGPRMAAFWVPPPRPPTPSIGRMIHAPEVPAGALHRGVVIADDAKPLSGAHVRIRQNERESVVTTDDKGAFEVQADNPGTIELFLEGTDRKSSFEVVKPKDFSAAISRFGRSGDIVNVPGVFSAARLGDRPLALATTQLKKAGSFSTVVLPTDQEEGPSEITLVDAEGVEHKHSVFVYRVLAGRIDNPTLIAGQKTQGEFVVCFGNAQPSGQRLNALLTTKGFLRFLGKGAKGHVLRQRITVAGEGTARIPFRVQGLKGAGPGMPFFINLTVTD